MLVEMPIESARDRLLLLNSMPNLSGLDEDALALLAERTRLCRFKAGSILLEQGVSKPNTYLLTQGAVTVYHSGEFMTRVQAPGGVGLIAVLADDTDPIRAVAETDIIALETPVSLLLDSFEENFSALRNALRLLSRQLIQFREHLPGQAGATSQPEIGQHCDEPQSSVELILRVSQSGLFAGRNLDAVIDIVRCMREVRFKTGAVIWERGAPPHELIRVDYGRIECTNEAGQKITVGADFVLGILDVLADAPRAYRAVAMTDVVAFRTRRDELLNVLETHFDLARALLGVQAGAVMREMTTRSQRARATG